MEERELWGVFEMGRSGMYRCIHVEQSQERACLRVSEKFSRGEVGYGISYEVKRLNTGDYESWEDGDD